jgi:hypothetical protein
MLHSRQSLLSVDPKSGATNWEIKRECADRASTTVAGNLLLVPFDELTALRPLGSTGTPETVWSESRFMPDMPTPVAYKDRVYVLKGSILMCAELETGALDWHLRLDCGSSYASPVAGNDHVYLADENGVLQSIRLGGKKGEVASRIELEEKILCTPALANGALYVRSDKHLWKFAERK